MNTFVKMMKFIYLSVLRRLRLKTAEAPQKEPPVKTDLG